MLLPLTDFLALLGLDLVLCAGCMRVLNTRVILMFWRKALVLSCFLLLWLPVGAANLPILAYVRGVSSDLSITLVVLACIGMRQRLSECFVQHSRERTAVLVVVAVAALFLYPMALGWGDWDAYRPGWGAPGMLAVLLLISLLAWAQGLRLLPTLVGLALLAWTAGLLESTNLWDYLIDPWLAIFAIFSCVRLSIKKIAGRCGRVARHSPSSITSE